MQALGDQTHFLPPWSVLAVPHGALWPPSTHSSWPSKGTVENGEPWAAAQVGKLAPQPAAWGKPSPSALSWLPGPVKLQEGLASP